MHRLKVLNYSRPSQRWTSNRAQDLSSTSIYQAMDVLCHHGPVHSKPFACGCSPSRIEKGHYSGASHTPRNLASQDMGHVLTMLALLICRASYTPKVLTSQDMGHVLTILALLAFPLHLLESQASERTTKPWTCFAP